MRVSEKHDHFGLDYHPNSRLPAIRGGNKFNPVRFNNTCYQFDSSVAVVNRESSSQRVVSDLIRKCPLRFKLDN